MDWNLLIKISFGIGIFFLSPPFLSVVHAAPQNSPYGVPKGFEPQKITAENRYQNVEHNEDEDLHYSDESPNYEFLYEIHGGGNLFGHAETRKDYQTNGKYHVLLPDGRRQVVTYYADQTGYHPTVTYEVVESNALGGYSQGHPSPSYPQKRAADADVPDLPVITGQQQDYVATLRPTYTGAPQRLAAAYGDSLPT